MQLSIFFASLVASAAAAVIDGREEMMIEKRTDLQVVLCRDPGLKGGCTTISSQSSGDCSGPGGNFHSLAQDGGNWGDSVSSASPLVDGKKFECKLYKDVGCKGPDVRLTGPAWNLKDQKFDNMASSMKCYWV